MNRFAISYLWVERLWGAALPARLPVMRPPYLLKDSLIAAAIIVLGILLAGDAAILTIEPQFLSVPPS